MAHDVTADTPEARLNRKRRRPASAATGWRDLGRRFADHWFGENMPEFVALWTSASEAGEQPVAIRVRAAAAGDLFPR